MSYVFHYAPDNASLAVHLGLKQVGAAYGCALVDRSQGAQQPAAYKALNRNGLIPTLETDQGLILESSAILVWLADRRGGLRPHLDSSERADSLKWLFFISNTMHSAQPIMCQRLETLAPVHPLTQGEGMNVTPFTKPKAPNTSEGSPI